MELFTAASSALDALPPRLMFATADCPARWLPVTQSTPAITPEVVPLPLQLRTRTATSVTAFATPYVEPPTVPETCVPWPLQSEAEPPGVTSSTPLIARPPNWVWVNRMPVSMMYAFTPLPVAVYVYVPESGSERWSIRSIPHVAPVWVVSAVTTPSGST